MEDEQKQNTAHRVTFNCYGVGLEREIEKNNYSINKSIEYKEIVSDSSPTHTAQHESSAVWEHLLFLEKAISEQNTKIDRLEQALTNLSQNQERQLNSRKLYAASLTDRKQLILEQVQKRKFVDVAEVQNLLHLNSSIQAIRVMKEVAKSENVAFIVGRSRVPSRLVSKNYTFEEIKEVLIRNLPTGSCILLSRIEEQFFVDKMKMPELVRSLAPQFKYLAWKDGARVERLR